MMLTLIKPNTTQRLGIMAAPNGSNNFPFADHNFYRQLCITGNQLNLEVFIFSLEAIDWNTESVEGFTYKVDNQKWAKNSYPLPKIIYDRCFYRTPSSFEKYRTLRSRLIRMPGVYLLGNGLKGKWEVHQTLNREPDLKAYLPFTKPLKSVQQLMKWLQMNHEAILKPSGGSQGRGVLHIRRRTQLQPEFQLHGRDRQNHYIHYHFDTMDELLGWIQVFTTNHHYLLQERLVLVTEDDVPFDVRSLMQKNEVGLWQLTGTAIRYGKSGTLTANLHGGGSATHPNDFLSKLFGSMKAKELIQDVTRLSYQISSTLETYHGRLVELGIDFGIDMNGQIWILEANSKPGRTIFTHLQDFKTHKRSIYNPIHYAKFMYNRYINQPSQFIQEGN
ncbi:YheC/YheD family protein [Paenibacillus albiflavus]|uniref:YheC/YheD family protein n=1 Tax=Paenibacillus albiflavus TaxID=2545760 RepID=A0A4R4EB18_9BACL|nr:YheC/YheD family protein [Paenibacillus albiflavus]TCZ75321.1 YheC/YheD family protein [Paenibacillus albiflavus]